MANIVASFSKLPFFKTVKHYIVPDLSSYDPQYKVDSSLLENCKPHHREVVQLALTDIYGRRAEAYLRWPAFVERYIAERLLNDAKDLPIALTFAQVTVWLCFSALMQTVLLPQGTMWPTLWAVPHIIFTWVFNGQRFILAMHYAAHRPLFSRNLGVLGAVLNAFPQTILSNFFGMPAGAYYVHHCVMHHQANNFFPYDVSSTMPYQRDSPLHFIAYVLNFMIHTFLYLPFYALRKKRYELAAMTVAIFVCYGIAIPYLYSWHPTFFITFLGVSSVLGPFALMLGNFSQHIFVDPDAPSSNYGLACNHINAPFNMLTFNDGYHITHHVSSITHWSEMPVHFIKNLDKYEEGGAIIFKHIPFDEITFNVWAGEPGLRRLAKKIVQITPVHKSEDELVAMMRKRLRPVTSEKTKLGSSQKGIFLANQALWLTAWFYGFPMAAVPAMSVPLFYLIYHFGMVSASLSW